VLIMYPVARVLFTFVSSLPPLVCRRARVLFTFVSSLPPLVCRRARVKKITLSDGNDIADDAYH
jgi:hypothetical protein